MSTEDLIRNALKLDQGIVIPKEYIDFFETKLVELQEFHDRNRYPMSLRIEHIAWLWSFKASKTTPDKISA